MAVSFIFRFRAQRPRALRHARVLGAAAPWAVLCLQLTGCVGELQQGTARDATTQEPVDGDDASVAAPDDAATVTPRPDTGVTSPAQDARVTDPPTPDAATERDARVTDPATPDTGVSMPDTGVPMSNKKGVFVAVGYAGVRMVSRDGGKTWGDVKTSGGGGDDSNLLRAVSFGNGLFVAVGSKIWTSADAVNWTERTNPAGQWMGGLEFGNGRFVAAGGVGKSIYSTNGTDWMAGKDRSSTEHVRSVAFGNGTWLGADDAFVWWSTSNGSDWTNMSGGHGDAQVIWCEDKFIETRSCTGAVQRNTGHTAFGDGVYVSVSYDKIERSEDGTTWTTVQQDPRLEDVVFGYPE